MQDDWTRAITCEYTGGDARFDFPIRPLGPLKLLGVFLIGFSVLFDWQPARMFWHSSSAASTPTGGAVDFFSLLFDSVFLLAGLVPMAIGLVILFGRCRVEWRNGRLRSSERLGPFYWTRRLPKKLIARFLAAGPTIQNGGGAPSSKALARMSSLIVQFEDGSQQWLVAGYPQEWLVGVAQTLQGYVGGLGGSGTPVPVAVVASVDSWADDREVFQLPAYSRAQVTGAGNNLRVFLPPLGLWRATKGFILFGLVWTGIMTCFVFADLHAAFKHLGVSLTPLPFELLFWVAGWAMLAAAVQLGRRTVEFVVADGQLRVTFRGPIRTTQSTWSQSEIAAIRVDRSNVEVNNRVLPELQIYPRTGKKQGMLAGHDEQELRWLATRLRQVLQVAARTV